MINIFIINIFIYLYYIFIYMEFRNNYSNHINRFYRRTRENINENKRNQLDVLINKLKISYNL